MTLFDWGIFLSKANIKLNNHEYRLDSFTTAPIEKRLSGYEIGRCMKVSTKTCNIDGVFFPRKSEAADRRKEVNDFKTSIPLKEKSGILFFGYI